MPVDVMVIKLIALILMIQNRVSLDFFEILLLLVIIFVLIGFELGLFVFILRSLLLWFLGFSEVDTERRRRFLDA